MRRGAIIFSAVVMAGAGSVGLRADAAFLSGAGETPASLSEQGKNADLPFFIGEYSGSKFLRDAGLDDAEYDALKQFYAARWNQPYWMGPKGPKPIAAGLVATLREAGSHALSVADFEKVIRLHGQDWSRTEPLEMARAEVRFMQAALLYARQASGGRVRPAQVGKYVDIKPQAADPAKVLDLLASHENPGEFLKSFHPRSSDYARLRALYLAYRNVAARDGWPEVRPGGGGKAIAALRQRLVMSGDLRREDDSGKAGYDAALRAAIRRFQTRHGIKADGMVGRQTLKALNVPVEERLEQLALNLERRRWLPDDLGARHVLVNQPEYKLRVVENGKAVHQTRVVIGKTSNQTPEFSDEIELVVFNPYWNVPRSIATKEILPILRRNPGYLARKGMQLVNGRGKTVSPHAINWSGVSRRGFRYAIRQRPGAGNALGRVKFLFPNEHSVYLHDTPSKSLFRRSARAFSHGCVRVQDPVKLAEVLMKPQFGWGKQALNRKIASRRNQAVRLKQPVPVHLTYHTVWVGEDGAVHFGEDMYGRDRQLAEAMRAHVSGRKFARLELADELDARLEDDPDENYEDRLNAELDAD